MDPHFEIAHLLDMRESASRVRFFAGDMTPVEGRGGLWRLPKSHRTLLQSVKDLILLYNRNYYGTIVIEQAKARGLGVSFDYGLECLWVENALITGENQMAVIIVLPKPLEAQANAASQKTGVPRGMEALIDDCATPKEPQRSGANAHNTTNMGQQLLTSQTSTTAKPRNLMGTRSKEQSLSKTCEKTPPFFSVSRKRAPAPKPSRPDANFSL
ncbi:hypothetical protein RB600_001632 [Gaeumannomyces tritici]